MNRMGYLGKHRHDSFLRSEELHGVGPVLKLSWISEEICSSIQASLESSFRHHKSKLPAGKMLLFSNVVLVYHLFFL